MKKDKIGLRILLLVVGIFIIGHGVALSIRSGLGTSPVSSVPYVLNLVSPKMTVGTYTIIINGLMVLLQVFILRRRTGISQLIQIPVFILFGLFVDINLYLTEYIVLSSYFWQLATVVISCFVMAFGVFIELKADVGYLPGDGLTLVISETYKKGFGKTKVVIDSIMVSISVVLVMWSLGRLEGVREGTIIAALFVGVIVQLYQKNVRFISNLFELATTVKYVEEPYMTTDNFMITIARQYGSGGHAVGEYIANKLGIAFYDSKLIDLTAIASGYTPEYVEKHEQKLPNGLMEKLYHNNYAFVNEAVPPNDKLFIAQTKVIRNIAASESCVIVGRSANFILKGHKNCFNVFVHADKEFRKKRVIENYMIDPEMAYRVMDTKDKERDSYSKHYTGKPWDDLSVYDMTVDTSLFGIEGTANMIIEAGRARIMNAGNVKSNNSEDI